MRPDTSTFELQQEPGDLVRAEIAVIANFSDPELAWQIEAEIRTQAELGYHTLLVHVPLLREQKHCIHPDINSCVKEGLALPLDTTSRAIKAKLALIYDSERIFQSLLAGHVTPLPRILADLVIAIGSEGNLPDGAAHLRQADTLVRSIFGAVTVWAAETRKTETRLRESGLHVLDELWRPSISSRRLRIDGAVARRTAPIVGCAGTAALSWYHCDSEEMRGALGQHGKTRVRILLPSRTLPSESLPVEWGILHSQEIGLSAYLRGLDFFVFCPTDEDIPAPFVAIGTALSCGVPTILHPRLEGVFGEAALYATAAEAEPLLLRHFQAGEINRADQNEARAAKAGAVVGAHVHGARLNALIGAPLRQTASRRRSSSKRVLFISTDVIGLGHLTRQLAIARRCPANVEPIFATASQGFNVVQQAGFAVEYLPYYDQARFEIDKWNDWLSEQLSEMVDHYSIDSIVFDGAVPHKGILQLAQRHRSLACVWVRRGMWRKAHASHSLDLERYFGLVIEPGEVAAANDEGQTPTFRCGVMEVPPICLLDADEILDRKSSATRLGLDPNRPAVLIQLGADLTRDLASVVDRVLNVLSAHPEIQPVLAEWNISSNSLELWPGLHRLHAFPLSRYFSAFDFSISAAGYNTFNETIAFGLPTIFLANGNPSVDDQPARAMFAEQNGAAVALSEHDEASLRLGVQTLLQEKARSFLTENCLKLARPNGAAAAAAAIVAMAQ